MFTSQGVAADTLGTVASDDIAAQLNNASQIVSTVINGTTFVYIGSATEDAVEIYTLDASGTMTNVGTLSDSGVSALQNVQSLDTFEVGGNQFLVAAGSDDSGFSVFALTDSSPYATLTDSALEALSPIANLQGVDLIEVLETPTATYIYAASDTDDGLVVYSVDSSGILTFVSNINDSASTEIGNVTAMHTYSTASEFRMVIADADNNTVSVYSVNEATGALVIIESLSVPAATNMVDIAAIEVGSSSFFYIADQTNGLFTLELDFNLSLSLAAQNSQLSLTGVSSVALFESSAQPYLLVQPEGRDAIYTYEISDSSLALGALNIVDIVGTSAGASRDNRLGTLAQVGDALFWLSPEIRLDNVIGYEIGAGDDVLSGSGVLTGGDGDDVLAADTPFNFVTFLGGSGADILVGLEPNWTTASYEGSDQGVTVNTQTGIGMGGDAEGDILVNVNNLIGSDHADVLTGVFVTGGGGGDLITLVGDQQLGFTGNGGFGNDTITGTNFNDTLDGGFSQDSIVAGDGNDAIFESPGDDFVDGGDGVDILYFLDYNGAITVNLNTTTAQNTGPSGTNVILNIENLTTGTGNDVLTGTTGANLITSSSGSDRIFGLGGDDTLSASGGNDLVVGGGGADTIIGGTGLDTLDGGTGNDSLFGYAGNDVVRGGTGADLISGGGGRDIMNGGTFSGGVFVPDGEADTFYFATVDESFSGTGTRDIIRDFEPGIDQIDLSAIDAIPGGANDAFTFIGTTAFSGTAGEVRLASAGAFTIVQADVDGDGIADFDLRLDGAPSLTAADFVL